MTKLWLIIAENKLEIKIRNFLKLRKNWEKKSDKPLSLEDFPQNLQTYGLRAVWTERCSARFERKRNALAHISQINALSVWNICWCCCNSFWLGNDLGHRLQLLLSLSKDDVDEGRIDEEAVLALFPPSR